LTFSATDLEVSIKIAGSEGIAVDKTGSVVVSAGKLKNCIDSVPTDRVSLRLLDKGRLEISAGESLFKLVCESSNDFPAIPDPSTRPENSFSLHPDDLQTFINACLHAVCSDETKHTLCGMLFKIEDEALVACSTDGHRLSLAGKRIPSITIVNAVIIPRKGLEELRKLPLEPLTVHLGDNNMAAVQGGTLLSLRLIEGHYPDYRRAIPTGYEFHTTCSGSALVDAVNRVKLMSRNSGIILEILDGAIFLRAQNESGDEAIDSIQCNQRGDALQVRLNARYLLDALISLGDGDIVIKYKSELNPLVILPANFGQWDERLEVLMPMRV
jgi:DNA polymerase-3 subunit beta